MARMFLDAGCPRMLHTCCHQPGKQRHPAQGHRRIDRCCSQPRVEASGAHAACCKQLITHLQHCSRRRRKRQCILPKGIALPLPVSISPVGAETAVRSNSRFNVAGWGATLRDAQVGMPHPGKATGATTIAQRGPNTKDTSWQNTHKQAELYPINIRPRAGEHGNLGICRFLF